MYYVIGLDEDGKIIGTLHDIETTELKKFGSRREAELMAMETFTHGHKIMEVGQ
jgi:hypothetical protein